MPPELQFNSDKVVVAAFNIVRRHGWEGLSARAIANELNSSTRPIYDHLKSMKHIEEEVIKKALAYFSEYISRNRTGDKWLDHAVGYVLFANEEKHLFRCINDAKHTILQKYFAEPHWLELGNQLSTDKRFGKISAQAKSRIRIARWFLVHGLAFLACNGWFEIDSENKIFSKQLNMELINFLKRANQGLFEAFKK